GDRLRMADVLQGVRSLANFGLLEGVNEASRRNVEERCRWRRYKPGQVIVDRDSTSREVFFVAEGAVRVVNYPLSGRAVAFADVGVGEYFGELAAIDGLPRTAGVRAITESLIGVLPGDAFLELLRTDAHVAFRILERLVHVVRSCDDRIMDLATLGAMQR